MTLLMLNKPQAISEKYVNLAEQLSDPRIVADMEKSKKMNKEYKKLQPIIEAAGKYEKVLSNLDSARALLDFESDPDMRELAKDEIATLEPELELLETELKTLLTP